MSDQTPETPETDETLLAAAGSDRNYASDRHLLLREIQVLSKEVGKLRGDTRYLNEVMVPREEVRRRRKVNIILVGIMLLLFFIAMGFIYAFGLRLSDTQQRQAQDAYEKCVTDQQRLTSQTKGIIEINALLASLRDAQTALAGRTDATKAGRETATAQAAAYTRYLNFVRETSQAATANPAIRPQDCAALKP